MILFGSSLNFLARTFLRNTPSESGYLLIFFATLLNSLIALGLGPNADSFAESLIFATFCLKRLRPAMYFSALIFFLALVNSF